MAWTRSHCADDETGLKLFHSFAICDLRLTRPPPSTRKSPIAGAENFVALAAIATERHYLLA